MSEIDEETIARAILHEEYGCAPEDVPNLYGKALATARLVMALVHPAIERARREGEFLEWVADRLVHVYGESPNVDFVHRLREIAAIRKG